MSCINLNELMESLEKIENPVFENNEQIANKDFRYATKDIPFKAVMELIRGNDGKFTPEGSTEETSLRGRLGNLAYKLNSISKIFSNENSFSSIPEVFRKDNDNGLSVSLALSEVLDAIKGEVYKGDKYGIPLEKFGSNVEGIPEVRVPFARVAAVLGRQIMSSRTGYVFGAHNSSKMSATAIEQAYQKIGNAALEQLKDTGYIHIDDKYSVINDFATFNSESGKVETSTYKTDGSEMKKAKSIRLNLSNDGSIMKEYGDVATKDFMTFLHDAGKIDPDEFSTLDGLDEQIKLTDDLDIASELQGQKSKINNINNLHAFVASVKRIVVPSTFVDVKTEPKSDTNKRDVVEPYSDAIKEGVEELNHTEQHIKQPFLHFLSSLANEYNNGKNQPLRGMLMSIFHTSKNVNENIAMRTSFGLLDGNIDTSFTKASIVGKNTSIISPLEDILGHITSLKNEDGSPKTFYNSSHSGGNARWYSDSAYMSIQSNKIIRDILGIGKEDENSFNIHSDKEAYNNLMTYILDAIPSEAFDTNKNNTKLSDADKIEQITGSGDKIGKLIDLVETMTAEDTGVTLKDRISALYGINKNMDNGYSNVKNPSFLKNSSILLAIKGIREAVKGDGTIKSDYLVDPDATANGATIKISEAIGSKNGEAKKLLEQVGVVNSEDSKRSDIDSIYDYINKEIIEPALDKTLNKDSNSNPLKTDLFGIGISPENAELLKLIAKTAYKGNMRNFAKIPAIPLIYGQGERASKLTIAKSIAAEVGVFFHTSPDGKITENQKELMKELKKEGGLLGKNKDSKFLDKITSKDVETITNELIKQDGLASEINGLMKKRFFGSTDGVLKQYDDLVKKSFAAAEELFMKGQNSKHFNNKVEVFSKKIFKLKNDIEAIKNSLNSKSLSKIERESLKTERSKLRTDLDKANDERKNLLQLGQHFMIAPPEVSTKSMMENPKTGFKVEKSYNVYDDKTGTITMKNFPAFTVFNVSATHMIDGNNQIGSGGKYLNLFDAKFANAKDSKKITKDYIDRMAKNIKEYNKVESLVKSMEMYRDLFYEKGSDEYVKYTNSIDQQKDAYKPFKDARDKMDKATINRDSGVLFGEKPVELKDEKPNVSTEEEQVTDDKGTAYLELLNKGNKETPIIDEFLKLSNKLGIDVVNSDEHIDDPLFQDNSFEPSKKGGTINLASKASNGNNLSESGMTKIATHEILHGFTTAWIHEQSQSDKPHESYEYLKKALSPLKKLSEDIGGVSGIKLKRVFEEPTKEAQIAELISLIGSDERAANNIYSYISKEKSKSFADRIKNAIQSAVKAVTTYLKTGSLERLEKDGLNVEDLRGAITDAISNSIHEARTNPDNFKVQSGNSLESNGGFVKDSLGFIPKGVSKKADRIINNKIEYLNKLTERVLTQPIESKTKIIAGNIDDKLSQFKSYKEAKDLVLGVYNKSDALQQLVQYMKTPDKLINRKAGVLTLANKVDKETQDRTNETLNQIHHLTSDFTKEGKSILSDITSLVPMQHIFKSYPSIGNAKDFKSTMEMLSKEATASENKFVNELVSMLVDGKVENTQFYSIKDRYSNGPKTEKLEALLALKALEKVDPEFKSISNIISNHSKLYDIIKDNSMALHLMHNDLSTGVVKDIQVTPHYEDIVIRKVFSYEDRKMYDYGENSGWEILTNAKKDGTLGVAFKKVVDKQTAQGAGVDVQLPIQDLVVPSKYISNGKVNLKNSNVVRAGDSYRLVLTKEQHAKIGKVSSPAENLVRSASNMIHLKQTEVIRDEVTKDSYTMKINNFNKGGKELNKLEKLIKSTTVDHPWFLKVPDDMNYQDAPAFVKANYKPIQTKMSNVNDFDTKVSWVRKDISHWLTGYNKGPLFKSQLGQKVSRVTKNMVALAKINMAIVNPIKLAKDAESSVNQLAMMGVPLSYVAKQTANFVKDTKQYKKVKNEMTMLQLKLYGNPDDKVSKLKLEKLSKSLEKNHMNIASELGFVNSLSSDVVSTNSQTRYGLAEDVDKVLRKVLLDNEGETNIIGKKIVQLSKSGFNGVTALNRIADYIEVIPGMEHKLEGIRESLEEMEAIRNEEDVVGMMRQWTLSPNSTFTKAGIEFNDLIDASSKYTLYRYLTEEKHMSHEKAMIKVTKAIPDYKEEMPSVLKLLSDYGVVMFPSFWTRIPQSEYMIVKENPISLIGMYGLGDMTGIHVESIMDANPYNKATEFGGMFHTPLNAISNGFAYPNNLLNH